MAHSWSYDEEHGFGPNVWATEYPNADGSRQSPVDIETARTLFSSRLCDPPLHISYGPEKDVKLRNNGHTVKAECPNQKSTLTGGPLSDTVYRLAQLHFHWGAEDDRGSEHTVDGQAYSAEIHFVHWNCTNYKSFEETVNENDGLAVLSVLVKVGTRHDGFEVIRKHLDNVTFKGDTFNLGHGVTFDPSCLLPKQREQFWTYPGSLTTPPCYESVQFIVFQDPVQFSTEQLTALRSLRSGDKHLPGDYLRDNFRPTCDLGLRTVQASFKP
ncbi:hypothetical protein ACOMHN_041200 [Nucella lapillus]